MLERATDPTCKDYFWHPDVVKGPIDKLSYNGAIYNRISDLAGKPNANQKWKEYKAELRKASNLLQIDGQKMIWAHDKHIHMVLFTDGDLYQTNRYKNTCKLNHVVRKTSCVEDIFPYILYMVGDKSHCFMGADNIPMLNSLIKLYKMPGLTKESCLEPKEVEAEVYTLNMDDGQLPGCSFNDGETDAIAQIGMIDDEPEVRGTVAGVVGSAMTDFPDFTGNEDTELLSHASNIMQSSLSDRCKHAYKSQEKLAKVCYLYDAYSGHELLKRNSVDCNILLRMNNNYKEQVFTYARQLAMVRGVTQVNEKHFDRLNSEEIQEALMYFENQSQEWQKLIIAVAVKLTKKCAKKTQCIYVYGTQDVGKSFLFQGLLYLKPNAPSLTIDSDFRFQELSMFNLYAIYDDSSTMFVNHERASQCIQIMGGQNIYVSAKYQPHTEAYTTPIFVLSNMYNFSCKGYLSAQEQEKALHTRLFYHASISGAMDPITEEKLSHMWMTIIHYVSQVRVDFEINRFSSDVFVNMMEYIRSVVD